LVAMAGAFCAEAPPPTMTRVCCDTSTTTTTQPQSNVQISYSVSWADARKPPSHLQEALKKSTKVDAEYNLPTWVPKTRVNNRYPTGNTTRKREFVATPPPLQNITTTKRGRESSEEEDDPRIDGQWRKLPRWAAGETGPPRKDLIQETQQVNV
jgi:hypothetical protein